MTKKCNVCSYVGELTWRDGKYYCAMCGSEIAETDPVVQAQPQMQQSRPTVVVNNVNCPICKNAANNQFDGTHYRCSLCGTSFDLQQAQAQQYGQFHSVHNRSQSQAVQELKKQKDRNMVIGIVFVFLFWPVAIYFFYKAYQINKELRDLGY